jgi:hypothetical protein
MALDGIRWVSLNKLYFFCIMPLNTVGNERTQTCIDATQAVQHCKAHALIFSLIAGFLY